MKSSDTRQTMASAADEALIASGAAEGGVWGSWAVAKVKVHGSSVAS
jgi:hypothetical protein